MKFKLIKCMTGIIMLLGMVNLASIPSTAQEKETVPDFRKIDSFIKGEMKACRIPGLALGIVKGNEIIYQQGYGAADPTGREVTPGTPFMIASLSKSFTAMAIMQLVEAGKVNLDNTVQTYLPGFQLSDKAAAAKITIRELLNHTSGISERDENTLETLQNDRMSMDEYVAKAQRIKPGKKVFQYINMNYNILGKIIESVTGQSYEEYITENIFAPLEMKHSYVSQAEAQENGMAVGYRSLFGFPVPVELPYQSFNLPAAGIISCSEDISKYMTALLNNGTYKNKQILSKSYLEELMSPSAKVSEYVSYGLGWYVTSGSVYHGGEFIHFQSKVKLLPEDSLGVVILYNTSNLIYNTLFKVGYRDRIESGIISILYGYEPDLVQPGSGILDLNHYPMVVTYTVYAGLYLIVFLLLLVSVIRLKHFNSRLRTGKKTIYLKLIPIILLHILLPVLVLILIPGITGLNWPFFLFNLPDLGYFILISGVIDFAIGSVKILLLIKYLKQGSKAVKEVSGSV